LALAICVATTEAFAPSFMGQGLNLRQAKASSSLSMKIALAPLPYDYTALEPKIGKETLEVVFTNSPTFTHARTAFFECKYLYVRTSF